METMLLTRVDRLEEDFTKGLKYLEPLQLIYMLVILYIMRVCLPSNGNADTNVILMSLRNNYA
jgi:hypothetical protein